MKIIYEGEIVFIDQSIKCEEVAVIVRDKEFVLTDTFFSIQQFLDNENAGVLGMIQRIGSKESNEVKQEVDEVFSNFADVCKKGTDEFVYVCYYKKIKDRENVLLNTLEMIDLKMDELVLTRQLIAKNTYFVKKTINRWIEHKNGHFHYLKIYFEEGFAIEKLNVIISNVKSYLISSKTDQNIISLKYYIEDWKQAITFTFLQKNYCYVTESCINVTKDLFISYHLRQTSILLELKSQLDQGVDLTVEDLINVKKHKISLDVECKYGSLVLPYIPNGDQMLCRIYHNHNVFWVLNTLTIF